MTGAVIIALGGWSVLVPLVGPYFGYAISPVGPWTMPWAALWLQIVPGVVLLFSGIQLVLAQRRSVALAAGALAAGTGVRLAVGSTLWPSTAGVLLGGMAAGGGGGAVEQIGMSCGLGAVVTLLAGLAIGRFSVCATRDGAAGQEQGAWAGRPTGPGSDSATRTASPGGAAGPDDRGRAHE